MASRRKFLIWSFMALCGAGCGVLFLKRPISKVRWRNIVIHHSASDWGNSKVFEEWHRKKGLRLGMAYHFVIGNGNGLGNGVLETGSRWTKQLHGAHLKNWKYNLNSIGVCLVGNFENYPPSPDQLSTLNSLVKRLSGEFTVLPSAVQGHNEIPGESTLCPGSQFDLEAFRSGLSSWRPV